MIDRRQQTGFTLIEVMMAVSILSLGTVMIQQGLLRQASILGRASHALAAQGWMDEKIWEAKEALFFTEDPAAEQSYNGSFTDAEKLFHWILEVQPIAAEEDLYLIRLSVDWLEGNRPVQLVREGYATRNKQ